MTDLAKVNSILKQACIMGVRLRIFYSADVCSDVALDCLQIKNTQGNIGSLSDDMFIPVLLPRKNSKVSEEAIIPVERVIKITQDKMVLWQHPNYIFPTLQIRQKTDDAYLLVNSVISQPVGTFFSYKEAIAYAGFLRGESNGIYTK